jgi:hypothetical protein
MGMSPLSYAKFYMLHKVREGLKSLGFIIVNYYKLKGRMINLKFLILNKSYQDDSLKKNRFHLRSVKIE